MLQKPIPDFFDRYSKKACGNNCEFGVWHLPYQVSSFAVRAPQ